MTLIFCEFYKLTIPDGNAKRHEPRVPREDTHIDSVELSYRQGLDSCRSTLRSFFHHSFYICRAFVSRHSPAPVINSVFAHFILLVHGVSSESLYLVRFRERDFW
jgi:hypothetical protein